MRLQAPSPGTIQKAKEVLERLPKIIRRAQVTPTQVRDTIGEGGLLQRNAFYFLLQLFNWFKEGHVSAIHPQIGTIIGSFDVSLEDFKEFLTCGQLRHRKKILEKYGILFKSPAYGVLIGKLARAWDNK